MSETPEILDRRRTHDVTFSNFRSKCLKMRDQKDWVDVNDRNPSVAGLYFIKHKDFLADIDITEYTINKKGKGYWCCMGQPTHWAKIETYDY
jgi:hypothetical protein